MLLKNSKAPEKIATENANLFVRIGKAILDVLEKAAEDEGLKLSEEIDEKLTNSSLNDYNEFGNIKSNNTSGGYVDEGKAISKRHGSSHDIGRRNERDSSDYENSGVGSEGEGKTNKSRSVWKTETWRVLSYEGQRVVPSDYSLEMKEILNSIFKRQYDKRTVRKMLDRAFKSYGKERVFTTYNRTDFRFSDSNPTGSKGRIGFGVYEDSQRGTGREKIPSEDKRYSERETGVASEESNESNSRGRYKKQLKVEDMHMEFTDLMREITDQVAKTIIDTESYNRTARKGIAILRSSSSEEEYIQKMKEAFPEAFQK